MSSPSIDRAREEIDAAWLRSDADGITQHLAEDAVLMPPHDTKKVGQELINNWLRGFFDHYTLTDLAMPEREVTVAGDYAIERSLYEWTLRPKDGSEPMRWRRARLLRPAG